MVKNSLKAGESKSGDKMSVVVKSESGRKKWECWWTTNRSNDCLQGKLGKRCTSAPGVGSRLWSSSPSSSLSSSSSSSPPSSAQQLSSGGWHGWENRVGNVESRILLWRDLNPQHGHCRWGWWRWCHHHGGDGDAEELGQAIVEQPRWDLWATPTSLSSPRLICGMCSKTTLPPGTMFIVQPGASSLSKIEGIFDRPPNGHELNPFLAQLCRWTKLYQIRNCKIWEWQMIEQMTPRSMVWNSSVEWNMTLTHVLTDDMNVKCADRCNQYFSWHISNEVEEIYKARKWQISLQSEVGSGGI